MAIKKAIDEIKYDIPKEILNQVFFSPMMRLSMRSLNYASSLDDQIINNVIRPRVLVDCDLVGGTEIFVSLEGLPADRVDTYLTVYNIPKDRTQGRSIVNVSNVSYLSASLMTAVPGFQPHSPGSVTPLNVAGQALFDSVNTVPVMSTARVRLIGENTVLIQDIMPPLGHGYMRCTIANEEDMGNIQMKYIHGFCELCILACKAYIYNEYVVTLDKGQLNGGMELGKFREIIDSYSESNKEYREYLRTKWRKLAFMNDREKHSRLLKLKAGPFR